MKPSKFGRTKGEKSGGLISDQSETCCGRMDRRQRTQTEIASLKIETIHVLPQQSFLEFDDARTRKNNVDTLVQGLFCGRIGICYQPQKRAATNPNIFYLQKL